MVRPKLPINSGGRVKELFAGHLLLVNFLLESRRRSLKGNDALEGSRVVRIVNSDVEMERQFGGFFRCD
jgi:ribosome-associated protein YbcJ (S4-like RNA binding protein)